MSSRNTRARQQRLQRASRSITPANIPQRRQTPSTQEYSSTNQSAFQPCDTHQLSRSTPPKPRPEESSQISSQSLSCEKPSDSRSSMIYYKTPSIQRYLTKDPAYPGSGRCLRYPTAIYAPKLYRAFRLSRKTHRGTQIQPTVQGRRRQ